MHKTSISFFFIFLFFMGPPASADQYGTGFFTNAQTRMGVDYIFFSGEKYKSLSSNSNGYGLEIGRKLSNSAIGLSGKVRGLYVSGNEHFLDGSTDSQLTYVMLTGEAFLGLSIYLIPSKETGFRPYIGGSGGAAIVQLRLPSSSVTTLNASQTALSLGYEIIAGIELNTRNTNGTNMWSIYGEFVYRNMQANLANQSPFNMSGITLVGGIGW